MHEDIRSKILSADDIKKEVIHVEEWGVSVEVWGLTSGERAKCVEAATVEDEEGNATVSDTLLLVPLVIAGTHHPESKGLLFTEADREALNGKSAKPVEHIAHVVIRLSGMGKAEQEKIQGNSSKVLSAGSTSA